MFVEGIKDAVITKSAETVKTNLSSCLQESTLIWYIEGLNDLEQHILRGTGKGVDLWCTALIDKFKESISTALDNITREAYTIEDVRKKRDISSYVFVIVQYVKGANVKDIERQLAWTYKKLALELAQDIPRPTGKTTINKFIASLEDIKEIWYKIYGED